MIGKTKVLLYSDGIGGSVGELIVSLIDTGRQSRLVWAETSKIESGKELEENAKLILEDFVDPLAKLVGLPSPRFRISFQKTPWFAYKSREHPVSGTSAGAALLVAMNSALLQIPIDQSIVVTGAVDPPHTAIRLVSGIKDKIEAAANLNTIKEILVPDPTAHFQGMSDKPQEVLKYKQWFRSIDKSKVRLFLIKSIDDIWEKVFPVELIYGAVLSNNQLYKTVTDDFSRNAPFSGLLDYIKGIYKQRWRILRELFENRGFSTGKKAFKDLIGFYLLNKENPLDIFSSYKELISGLSGIEGHQLLNVDDWIRLSDLYNLEKYDELAELLYLIVHNKKTGPTSSEDRTILLLDPQISDAIKEKVITDDGNQQYDKLVKLLRILVQVFTSGESMPSVRHDIEALIKRSLLDTWTDAYHKCCKSMVSEYSKIKRSFNTSEDFKTFKERHFGSYFNLVRVSMQIIETMAKLDLGTAFNLVRYVDDRLLRLKRELDDKIKKPPVEADSSVECSVFVETCSEVKKTRSTLLFKDSNDIGISIAKKYEKQSKGKKA